MDTQNGKPRGKLRGAIGGLARRVLEALDVRKMSKGQALYTYAFLAIAALMIFLYAYTFLVDKTMLTRIIVILFIIPVTAIGAWGIPLYFGIMLLQCIVAPIPSEIVQVTGGLIFGWGWGSILSLTGIMFTAYIGYHIAIKGGARVIEAAIGKNNMDAMETFIGKHGIWAMILGRGVPFIPFDLLTYGAGLVKMGRRNFIIGTFIGAIPRSIFYAWVGSVMFPHGGAQELLALVQSGDLLAFDAMLAVYADPFNFFLTITMLILAGGFALFYLVFLPLLRRSAGKARHATGDEPSQATPAGGDDFSP